MQKAKLKPKQRRVLKAKIAASDKSVAPPSKQTILIAFADPLNKDRWLTFREIYHYGSSVERSLFPPSEIFEAWKARLSYMVASGDLVFSSMLDRYGLTEQSKRYVNSYLHLWITVGKSIKAKKPSSFELIESKLRWLYRSSKLDGLAPARRSHAMILLGSSIAQAPLATVSFGD